MRRRWGVVVTAVLALIALLVAARFLSEGADHDCSPADPTCRLDERAGTYGVVGVGSSVEDVLRALGEPDQRGGGYAPAGRLASDVGVPLSIPVPAGGEPGVYRYGELAFLISGGRVFSFMVTAERAETTRGVGVGDSLDEARGAYDNVKCGEVVAGEAVLPFQKAPTYSFCRAVISPGRFVWFGRDPIANITLSDYSGSG